MQTWRHPSWLACIGLLALFVAGASQAAKKTDTSRGLQPISIAIPGQAKPVQLYGESHALVIGEAQYNNGWPKLSGVEADVEAVAQALEKQGFAVTTVMNPGRDQLDAALRGFIARHGRKPDNRLLVYYAGHGHTLKVDGDRQLGYLVPVDAPLEERDPGGFIEKTLSMETLEGYAKQIRAKHALFVFDACFSGTFFKMRAAPEVIALKTTQPVRQFITSGSADQQVPDVSVFRKEFVAALDGEADLNRDGYVTGSELGSYLEDKVTNYSRQTQIPQYGKIQDRNLDKGDFVFALNRPELPPSPEKLGPAAPASAAMSLDAIRKHQELRDSWEKWQTRMRADYEQVDALSVAPELKATAWEQFLAAYPQTNPYSQEAETLRGQARAGLLAAKQQAVRLADGGERAISPNMVNPSYVPAPASKPDATNQVSAPALKTHILRFVPTLDAWIQVVDGKGKRFYKLVRAGEADMFAGEPPFRLVVGEAAHMQLSYDGHSIDLTPYIGRKVARLTLE